MRYFFIIAIFVLLGGSCLAQNVRYDAPFPSITSIGATPYLIANVPPLSPILAVCHNPANNVPCTNYATTFTGAGIACPNGAQDTPQPSALITACQATGDARGNIGFWAPGGTYDYTVCVGLTCFGPFTVQLISGGGGGGVPGGVTVGSVLVSNGVSQPPIYQTKTVYDMRDFGVVGDGITNDTSAFQNAINAACGSTLGLSPGAMLTIPKFFNIKITSTININQCGGLLLDGQSSIGQAGFGAIITWAGGNGGTVFSVNHTRDSIFRNFSIQALNSSNIYNIGFDIDENVGSGITSHNLYQNLLCGGLPGGTQNPNFVCFRIGQNAPGNTEQQVFEDVVVGCGGGTLTDTSNGIGIQINKVSGSAQPFYIPIVRAEILGCSHGIEVNANARDVIIDGGNYGTNFHSLYLRGGNGVAFQNITTTTDVSSSIYLNGFSGQLQIRNNQFTGGGANVIDVTNASGGAKLDVEYNDFGGIPMFNGTLLPGSYTGFINAIGNSNFATQCPSHAISAFGMFMFNIPTSGTCQENSSTFAQLPSAAANGIIIYCTDCKNVTDDTTGTFDSVATSGGHGTNVLRENGTWRVH